jgi:predicted nuclease of restriction endonuclease-like (RecB) superfamily
MNLQIFYVYHTIKFKWFLKNVKNQIQSAETNKTCSSSDRDSTLSSIYSQQPNKKPKQQ